MYLSTLDFISSPNFDANNKIPSVLSYPKKNSNPSNNSFNRISVPTALSELLNSNLPVYQLCKFNL